MNHQLNTNQANHNEPSSNQFSSDQSTQHLTVDSSGLVTKIFALLKAQGWKLATAESLTAGAVSAALAEVDGASEFLEGGVVAYQNQVKSGLLSVDADRLAERGPVDPVVAQNMAQGAIDLFGVEVAISTTGVAGPGPQGEQPAGTVYICVQTPAGSVVADYAFAGERNQVRALTVQAALELVCTALQQV